VKRHKITGDMVVLVPAGGGALQIGVTPAEDGKLQALLTIHTADLGTFVVVLTAADLGLLVASGKTLLGLDADRIDKLRKQINDDEGETK